MKYPIAWKIIWSPDARLIWVKTAVFSELIQSTVIQTNHKMSRNSFLTECGSCTQGGLHHLMIFFDVYIISFISITVAYSLHIIDQNMYVEMRF